MARAKPEALVGGYIVVKMDRLKATADTDPAKWELWRAIWTCTSFEQLASKAPADVFTSATGRRITWQSEVRWALRQGWIKKVKPGLRAQGPRSAQDGD